MNHIESILSKLSEFRRKYHLNELVKGALFLSLIISLYFILILVLEKFLWLSSGARTFIFWISLLLIIATAMRFIVLPIIRMFSNKYKISKENASKLIGNHFPEISDQLSNLLQFDNEKSSELVLAAIDERAKNLSLFTFSKAIDLRKTLTFAKWLVFPLAIFIFIALIFGLNWFKSPLDRVVNYNTAFIPPAPFKFIVDQNTLQVLEGDNATVRVSVVGNSLPENAKIVMDDKEFFLNKESNSQFSHTIKSVSKKTSFFIKSGDIRSQLYEVNILETPSISDFSLRVDPPSYTGLRSTKFKEQGNIEVPAGSKVIFSIKSPKATKIEIDLDSITNSFAKVGASFKYSKRFKESVNYTILSSNENVKHFEKLNYQIDVLPDRTPIIRAEQGKDSLNVAVNAFKIEVGDDYGFSKLEVVQLGANEAIVKRIKLERPNGVLDLMELDLSKDDIFKESGNYSFYFEVFDNDVVNGSKSAKSEIFSIKKKSEVEELAQNQKEDDTNISNFDSSLEKLDDAQKEFEEFNKLQKQKTNLDYKDKHKLENLLEKQQNEQKELQKLNAKLKETLENLDKKEDTEKSLEALERMKEELEKNNKLIDEIKKALKELDPKEAKEKMEELNKNNKSSKKSLKQILDLTKRFYVIDKHSAIISMLELLAKEHDSLSTKMDLSYNKKEQDRLGSDWDSILEELNDLRRKNAALRRPMVLDDDKNKERRITKEIEAIKEFISDKDITSTNKGQRGTAAMLRSLAKKMGESPAGSGGMSMDEIEEDKEMLRKVLDNLVVYSLDQEGNMNLIKGSNSNDPSYSNYVRKQHGLKENFAHIDDSLFAIASRNPKIDLKINRLISEVNYNIESSITKITDNQSRQGAINMQYAITSSNELGLMIAETILELDKPTKPQSGEGKPKEDFQLPDIIKKQKSIQQALDQLMKAQQQKSGESKSQGDSNKPKEGEKGSESEQGKDGDKGSEGSKSGQGKSGEGESGSQGSSSSGKPKESGDKQGKEGKSGDKKGENGEGGKEGDGKKGDKDGNEKGKDGEGKDGEGKDGKGEGKGKEGEGKKGSKKGNKQAGEGDGNNFGDEENDLQQIFQIYKEQQDLRNQLEDAMSRDGLAPDEKRILNQMKAIENELIEQGFDNQATKRMENLKHQLFKLNKAQFEQGKDDKRKSNKIKKSHDSEVNKTDINKVYYNTKEILNRQVLPLQSDFKKRVKTYFLK